MINRRQLIGKFGSAALVAGAAAVVIPKPALAGDDGYQERREEDREYHYVFEEFDECEGKVIKITEHVRLHVKHHRRDDGYHKYECHEYWDAQCDNDNDGYWVETCENDYEVIRHPRDNDCFKPFSHKERYQHKLWRNNKEDRGTIWVNCEFFVNASGHFKCDYKFDFDSACRNKCDNY